jgi:antitoxin ChpS
MVVIHTTRLRNVGGSVMLAVPHAVLNVLGLRPGAKVGIAIERGRLVVEPPKLPRDITCRLVATSVLNCFACCEK